MAPSATSAKGVDFFSQLNKAGNFLPVDPTPATIESGQTPVVIDWDYLNAAQAELTGKLDLEGRSCPKEAVIAGYYSQAVNKDAPHPAAARLWQEFLYSDEGQNLWLKGGARPVRFDAMKAAGTARRRCGRGAAPVEGTPIVPTQADAKAARPTWPPTGPTPLADAATPTEGTRPASRRRVPSWASSPSSPTRRSSC